MDRQREYSVLRDIIYSFSDSIRENKVLMLVVININGIINSENVTKLTSDDCYNRNCLQVQFKLKCVWPTIDNGMESTESTYKRASSEIFFVLSSSLCF